MVKKVFMLILVLSIGIISSVNASTSLMKSERVSTADAIKAAQKFIKESNYSSKWNSAELKYTMDLYDIDETLVGYYYTVIENSMSIGHLVVSATIDRGPILQYGDGIIKDNQDSGKRAYYVSGIVHAIDAAEILEKANGKKINLKLKEKTPSISTPEWERLLSNDSTIQSSPSSKTLGITRLSQRQTGVTNQNSSCGPTSGAMITNYLRYSHNVPYSGTYGGSSKHINHLYNEMSTTMFGTSLGDFSVGLLNHLRHYGEKWVGTEHRGTESIAWNTFKGDIDLNKPVGIRFDYWVSGSTYVNYHFVAGEGYTIYNYSNYFGFKDPDGSDSNTIWKLWADNDQDIGFLHLHKQP